jgi:hypothetical protein
VSDPGTTADDEAAAAAASPEPEVSRGSGADDAAVDEDAFDELREAAGAVVASLKWLIDATERVIEDPAAFSQVVDSGRSVVEAFTSGFLHETDEGDADPSPDS